MISKTDCVRSVLLIADPGGVILGGLFLIMGLSLWGLQSEETQATLALDIEESKQRCQSTYQESQETFLDELSWGMTLLEMEDTYHRIYNSGGRLPLHAHFDKKQNEFVLHFRNIHGPKPFPISEDFIKTVATQISVALEKGFADFVFFSDMGHSHLYLPEDHWQAHYEDFDTSHNNQHNLYKKMFSDPKLKSLYHLAEQLKMTDAGHDLIQEGWTLFKYWHRNFMGHHDGSRNYEIHAIHDTDQFNTVRSLEGYHRWSNGFAVQASREGCFAFIDKDGKKAYFDISIYSPRSHPSMVGAF